ncbi:MAG: PIN domain-containing protein [bacterium]|nr:PIN domain-containing protein [bacterium]
MVTTLVDTSVLIDALRHFQQAEQWLSTQKNLGVVSPVWLEVLDGTPNKREQLRALQLLSQFDRVDLTPADFDWAILQQTRYKLSHNVGGIDCLIAVPSHRLNVPLYTMNLKHFTPMLGALAISPY